MITYSYPFIVGTFFDGRPPVLPILSYEGDMVLVFVPSFPDAPRHADAQADRMTANLLAVWPMLTVVCIAVTEVPENYLWKAWVALQTDDALPQL